MKVLSLFSGIGAFEKALTRLNIDFELVNYCDIDKYASRSYAAVHGVDENKNLWDITKIDTSELPDNIDLVTYGFPCQDISQAGKQRGFSDENGQQTRSGLFFEALRIIEDKKPKIAICENVKNLTSKKFEKEFGIVLSSLENAGYHNYWKILNAKDYGIPQNRERVFIVSVRNDIDKGFEFPEKMPLDIVLSDLLDPVVDERFYLSNAQIKRIKETTYITGQRRIQEKEWADTLCARDYKDPKCVQVAQMYGTEKEPNPQAGRIYSPEGISPTMDTCSGGNRMPKILVREATKAGYAEAFEGDSVNLEQPNRKTRRGRVGHQRANTLTTSCNQGVVVNGDVCRTVRCGGIGSIDKGHSLDIVATSAAMRGRGEGEEYSQRIEVSDRETANSITTVQKDSLVAQRDPDETLAIRKLTPLECWRLMGFDDEDFNKAKEVNSDSQLYKQAGNSIVVNVLEAIFRKVFEIYGEDMTEEEIRQATDGLLDEELDDFASSIFNPMLAAVCRFADRHNYDRDNILAYTGHMITDMAEMATIKHYEEET